MSKIFELFGQVTESFQAAGLLRDMYRVHRHTGGLNQNDAFEKTMATAKQIEGQLDATSPGQLVLSELIKKIEGNSSILDAQYFRKD